MKIEREDTMSFSTDSNIIKPKYTKYIIHSVTATFWLFNTPSGSKVTCICKTTKITCREKRYNRCIAFFNRL